MTLHLYFARRFLVALLATLGAVFLMLALISMLDQVRRFDTVDLSFGAILTLTLLNVPEATYRALPLVTILGSLAAFVSLSRSSEMVISRAAGRAALVSLVAPVFVAFLVGCAAVAALNPIVAATSKQYDTLANRYSQSEESILSISREGLWLRQGGPEGQTVIRAARANLDGTELLLATFYSYGADGSISERIVSRRAVLTPGAWMLTDAKRWPLAGTENPERAAELHETYIIPTDLTRNQIIDSFGTPSAISIWQLPGFIAKLEEAGFSARQHRVWLQMELASPILLAAMVLICAGFTLRPARFGRTGLMVMLAIVAGFTLYFLRNFAQILGENGQIPVALAAWGPPIAIALLPLGLLLHLEDG